MPHLSDVKSLVDQFSPQLIAISETWCTDRVPDANIDIEHYVLLRNDRGLINLDSNRDSRGGGVALYVHKSLSFSPKGTIRSRVHNVGEVEYLIQKVTTQSGSSLLMAVVYRPPLSDGPD